MKKTFTLILSLSLMMTLNAQVKTANNSRKVLLADKEVQQKIAANKNNPNFNLDAFLEEMSQSKTDNSTPLRAAGASTVSSAPSAPVGCTGTSTVFTQSTPIGIVDVSVVTTTLNVTGLGSYLFDLDLTTFITHSFGADMDITLTSPAGTVVTISTDNAAGNDNIFNGTVWDDDANPLGAVPYTTNNGLVTDHAYTNLVVATPLVPEEHFGAFIGENPNGIWTLTISDDLSGDAGTCNSWSLNLTTLSNTPTITAPVVFTNTTPTVLADNAVTTSTISVSGLPTYLMDLDLGTFITHTFSSDLDITITSPSGTVVTITTDNAAGNDNVFNGTNWDDDANPLGVLAYTTNNGLVTDQAYVNLTTANPLVPEEALAAFIGENPNGTWTLTVSDDIGGDSGTLVSWALAIKTAICCSNTTSSFSVASCATYTVPSGDETYTTSGTRMDTIPNFSGCDSIMTIAITINPLPVVAISGPTSVCSGSSVTLTGTSGGTSQWYYNGAIIPSATTNTYVATIAGVYNMTKTNLSGCVDSAAVGRTLIVNALPTVTASATASTLCAGDMVTLTGGGAASYAWDNGVVDGVAFASSTATTIYSVVGTDLNGCTNATSLMLTINALPTVTGSASASPLCDGDMVTLTGGGATSYVWDNSVVDGVAFASSTSTTAYNVVGTDGNGCTNVASVILTVNALPTVTASSTAAAVCAGGSVTLTGGGATSYAWDNSVVDGVAFTPASTLTYNVTGTDANGCVNTASTTVTVNTLPTVTGAASSSTLCAGDMVTLTGGGATSYAWDNSAVDGVAFASTTATTTYNVVGTDGNGCTNTASVTLTVNALPTVTATASVSSICIGDSVNVTGGGAVSYAWDNSVVDGVMFAPTDTTTYTVIGTDANGCMNTASTTIVVNPLPTVTASVNNDTVCSGSMITLTGGGATSYTWDNGATNAVAFAATVSTGYTVIGTDVNGCKNSDSVYVMVNALPSVSMSPFTAPVCLQLTSVTLTGGSPAGGVYSGTAVTGTTFNPTTAGVGTFPITYTVTDANACSNAASNSITVQDCTGIEENLSSSEVTIYPNPTIGSFNIAINNVNVDALLITIFDVQGKEVFTSVDKNVNGTFNKQINLDKVAKGVYFIRLSTGSDVKVQKLIVQ